MSKVVGDTGYFAFPNEVSRFGVELDWILKPLVPALHLLYFNHYTIAFISDSYFVQVPVMSTGRIDYPGSNNVEALLGAMELIVDGTCAETRERNSAIKLCEFVKENSNAVLLVERLFPGGIQSGEEFFDRLDEIRYVISIGKSANEAIGLLWSAAIGKSEGALRKELLSGLANQSGHHLYAFMESFYVVVRDNKFAAPFLTDCLVGLHDVAAVSYTHLTLPTICSV